MSQNVATNKIRPWQTSRRKLWNKLKLWQFKSIRLASLRAEVKQMNKKMGVFKSPPGIPASASTLERTATNTANDI